MIIKTVKIDYKLKDITCENGTFVDENGEVVDIAKDLATIFEGKEFSLSASVTNKNEYDLDDFSK